MNKNKIIIVLICSTIWIILAYVINEYEFISFGIETIKQYLLSDRQEAMFIFVLLYVIRLLVLLPGATLIILGGTLFGPINGFLLSMIGMGLSETLIYIIAKVFSNSKMKKSIKVRHPDIEPLMEKYNFRFLALGVLCPIAPSDVVCFVSASVGLNYIKYILTIIISNIPLIMLYSYMGISYKESVFSIIALCLSIILIAFYSIRAWNSLKVN